MAPTGRGMEILGSGLITLLNGFLAMLGAFASPMAIAAVLCAVGLAWFALLEIDELDRQGTKPEIGRH